MESINPFEEEGLIVVVELADSVAMDWARDCTFCGFTAMIVTSASAIPADGL